MTQDELYEKQVNEILVETQKEVDNNIEEIKSKGLEPAEIDYFDYSGECYKSALKAFKSLCDDGHSGYSFSITSRILKRMLDGLPLKKIQEFDFTENEFSWTDDDGEKYIMCDKMPSLWKIVHSDGKITYSEHERAIGVNIDNGDVFTSKITTDIVDELYPITMPYNPDGSKYKVYVKDFLVYPENGDFDTQVILYVETPKGDKVYINKFFHEKDHKMVEISKEEYDKLYKIYLTNLFSDKK